MKAFYPEQAMLRGHREFGEHGGVTPSIERSSTFTVLESDTMPEIFNGEKSPDHGGCYLYSRHFNPTVDTLAHRLAAMEDMEHCVCTASGISAISCAISQLCPRGGHVVSSNTVYGGTHALLGELLPTMGIETTFVDPTDVSAFESAMRDDTRVVYTEALGNPTLKVADIPALAEVAHRGGAKLVVDNTFTPIILSPARLGADVVVYSLTKFINGASDIIGGAICGSGQLINDLMDLHTGRVMLLGPTMDPRVAFDIYQRLPHLAIRMREHGSRAMAIASLLDKLGLDTRYPGLPSHPQQQLFASMLNEGYGSGGILTVDCKTTELAGRFMDALQNDEDFGYIAVSLGYSDTLLSCSGSSTSSEISASEQAAMGLSPGLVRMAVGYTGTEEARLNQVERAARKVGLAG